MSSEAPALGAYPIYGSTYSLYRLSPLHFRDDGPKSSECLKAYATRLRATLTGDQFRLGLNADQDDSLTRAGALKSCQWAWLAAASLDDDAVSSSVDGLNVCEGLTVDLAYETTAYRALLLRDRTSPATDMAHEMHLPLLCLRMPASLRHLFLEHLSTAFDTRAETMLIPSTTLAGILENFVEASTNEGSDTLQSAVREVQLSLAFRVPTLRSLDITIAREDILRFVEKGVSGDISSEEQAAPFFKALEQYFAQHLAMSFNHGDIMLSRIACGAFALGNEGKAKIFPPSPYGSSAEATASLLRSLLRQASGRNS